MSPWVEELRAMLRPSPPVAVVRVMVPRPLARIEYVPGLNVTMEGGAPLAGSTTSSIAEVMFPLPSAVKLPTRAMKPPDESSPLMAKAYWPFRLLSEKFPVGGGGGVMETPPLQAAAHNARTTARSRRTRFIAHLPPESRAVCRRRARRPGKVENRGWRGRPASAGPSELRAQQKTYRRRRRDFRRRHGC